MRQRKRKKRERARAVSAKRSKRRQTRAIVVFKLRSIWLEKESVRNVAHRKQRLPVLPLLQRDVSFAAHELVEHRAHLCRHLFLLHAQKKGGGGAFLLVRGESKALKEGTFSGKKFSVFVVVSFSFSRLPKHVF